MNATGWSCYTCKGQTESDRLADCLYKAAEQILKNQVIRTDYARDGDPDWEENFYILRHSLCPAVLVEQFFMDNKKDLAYLISDEGKRNLINVIVSGVENICPDLFHRLRPNIHPRRRHELIILFHKSNDRLVILPDIQWSLTFICR